jgi:hypothetical protein
VGIRDDDHPVPNAIVARLNKEVNHALTLPHVRERFAAFSVELQGGSPEIFAAQIRKDAAKRADVIERAGVKPEASGGERAAGSIPYSECSRSCGPENFSGPYPNGNGSYLLDDEAAPPEPLDAADPLPPPPLLLAAVPPVLPEPSPELELDEDALPALPPGITTVSLVSEHAPSPKAPASINTAIPVLMVSLLT